MESYELEEGIGRTEVRLLAYRLRDDLIVCIYNENAHIGAVAVGEYDHNKQRASISIITRLGHRDDVIAQQAAYTVSKSLKKPVCVIAGIHVDNITRKEIDAIVKNSKTMVDRLLGRLLAEPTGN